MIKKQSKSEDKLLETILSEINVGIVGIKNIALESDNLIYKTLTTHKLFDGIREIGTFDLTLEEQSTGTQKLVTLLAFITIILKGGDCLFIDEMSTSMHTEITTWLIDLFNNPLTNPNKAQLIITTHDITLIDKELYEKDQIFVVEKNKYGASEMYSFADITGLPRNNNRLSEYYETGRMGGVPHISKSYLQHEISQFLKDAEAEAQ
jgi:AAA15 family ATPase/GTPase